MKILIPVILIAFLGACVESEDLAEQKQAEIIEVHGGCPPGTIGNGEICVDPLEGGGSPGAPGGGGGEGSPSGPGRGGGGGADPNPIPTPKDCTVEADHELCYACCDWNVDKVWGERCRRLPRKERKTCWADAENRRGDCQRGCPRPIMTVAP